MRVHGDMENNMTTEQLETQLNQELVYLNGRAVDASKRYAEFMEQHKTIMNEIDTRRAIIRRQLDDIRRGI